MIPSLFQPSATDFDAAGLPLPDAVSCVVKQDDQARSELTLQYPIAGVNFDQLRTDAIVLVKPDPYTRAQPFRIYKASKPLKGLVSFSARHLIYDTLGIPVAPFAANNNNQAASSLIQNALVACPFSLTVYALEAGRMEFEKPLSLRAALVTDSKSFLKTYGGGLLFDRFSIAHYPTPGADRGVVISYGVDLVDVQQEENIANTYNGIIPFWYGTRTTTTPASRSSNAAPVTRSSDGDDTIVIVDPENPDDPGSGGSGGDGTIVIVDDEETVTQTKELILGSKCMAPGTWPVEKVQPVDFTEYFGDGNPPTAAQLNALAPTWISDHKIGIPEVSIKLQYAQIGQDVRLFDTVGVDFTLLGIQTSAKVTSTSFDVLKEIYTDIQIGVPRPEISDSLMDASRLKSGTIDSSRIGTGSIGGRQLATASVSEGALAAYAVTKNRLADLAVSAGKIQDGAVRSPKIQNGAVTEVKLEDEAVSTPKIRGNAVTYDCLSLAVQQLFVDILEANRVYAEYINADGLIADVVAANSYFACQGYAFYPAIYTLQLAGGQTTTVRLLRSVVY